MRDQQNPSPEMPIAQEPARGLTSHDKLSRRALLARSGGMAIAITGSLSLGPAGMTLPFTALPVAMAEPLLALPAQVEPFPAVPAPPDAPPRQITTLTEHEATTIEALMARLLPGTADQPGAREAGVIYYLDHLLGSEDSFAEATYRMGPYARTYEGEAPPTDEATALADGIVWVPASEIDRYGYQSPLTPLEVFQIGVRAIDAYATERFGSTVAELSEEQQDQIITALLDNEATGFEHFSPESFFHALRRRTDEGMFSDPLYGGNIDFAGWRLIGYPGAQRAYTATDIRTPGSPRRPQGLQQLHHFNPGQPADHPGVVLPVSGSGEVDPQRTEEEA